MFYMVVLTQTLEGIMSGLVSNFWTDFAPAGRSPKVAKKRTKDEIVVRRKGEVVRKFRRARKHFHLVGV